jgi:peroxiredoxin
MNAELVKAGVQVLVILGDTQERAREYAESTRAPFPILSDPERAIYHLYGLERGIFRLQRTASIIVDQDGLIRYLKRVTNPMTWLKESQDLLREVKRQ